MSADGWEPVTDPDTLREGEPLRVLGEEGWKGHLHGDLVRRAWLDGSPRHRQGITTEWLLRALCVRGQVERRVEPEPHPDDVQVLIEWGVHWEDAPGVVRHLNRLRRERGEQ